MTNALIIGRFQPFHLGHLRLIEEAGKEADRIIIGIGSSQYAGTPENPFTSTERREMIERSLKGFVSLEYEIYEIPDIGDNTRWVSHVASLVPEFDVVYTNGPLERKLFRDAGYRVHATGLYNRDRFEGTEIRRRIFAGGGWEELVPEGTASVIREVGGLERIRSIAP